ncbi:MAG: glutamate--tRNA ligase family protein, partial [Candidatus Syntropharchaeales archaeon]
MEETVIRDLIRRYALQNAVKYGQTPQKGAVMGKVMGEHPELRSEAKKITEIVDEVLAQVDELGRDRWRPELERIAPELIDEIFEPKEPRKGLPELEGAENGVIMRFAPNPNGTPTLGNARGIVVNAAYVKKYGGKLIIRFDDTDPSTKKPMIEAYDWYLEDISWLGVHPDEIIIASD